MIHSTLLYPRGCCCFFFCQYTTIPQPLSGGWGMSGIYIATLAEWRYRLSGRQKATTSIEVKWSLVNRSQMMMGILQKSRKRYRFSFQYNWGHVSLEHLHYKRPTTDGLTLTGKIGRVWPCLTCRIFDKWVPLIRASSSADQVHNWPKPFDILWVHVVYSGVEWSSSVAGCAQRGLNKMTNAASFVGQSLFTFSPRLRYSHIGIADPELLWIHTAHTKNTAQYIILDAIFAKVVIYYFVFWMT